MRSIAIYIFLLILISNTKTWGQHSQEYGKFFIKNYTVDDHKGETQTWAIIQDKRGVMYFGNNAGIIEYDGLDWRIIPTPNNSVVRSLDIDSSGTIYVGCVGEFGYLAPNEFGQIDYHSLTHLLDSADQVFKEVWMTCAADSKVYFSTIEGLFEFDKKCFENQNTKAFRVWRSKKYLMGVYNIHGEIITRQPSVGLVKLSGDSLELLPGTEPIANSSVWTIDPISKDKWLISIRGVGLVVYDKNKPPSERLSQPKSYNEASRFLVDHNLYYGSPIPSNRFVFGTLRNGAIIIDENGRILKHINEKTGLASNNVVCTFYNKGNLWLSSHKTISNIEINAPITLWDETLGLNGIVSDNIRFNDVFYTATTQGVFYLNNGYFEEINEIQYPSWNFIEYNTKDSINKCFVGTSRGIFEILTKDHGEPFAKIIVNIPYVYTIYKATFDKNAIFVGSAKGLFLLNLETKDVHVFSAIKEDIRNIVEDNNGDIWLSTRYNGVAKLVLKEGQDIYDEKSYVISKYNTEKSGLASFHGITVEFFGDKLLFLTASGVYEYNNNTDKLEYSNFSKEILNEDSAIVHKFHQDGKGNLWLAYNIRSNFACAIKKNEKGYRLVDTVFKRLKENTVIRYIFVEDNENIWVAATRGVYKFDYQGAIASKTSNFNTIIRSVKTNRDSVLYYGFGNNSSGFKLDSNLNYKYNKIKLDYSNNYLNFQYAAAFFAPEMSNEYSYKLERNGNAGRWSDWTKETRKEYTNLFEGDYVFYVKSRNIYEKEGAIDKFEFEILPPLHRTVYAYIFYVVFGIIVFFIGVKLYSRRLKAANVRLERIILERTSEINQQKEEIQTQNENLELINAQLRKLSVVASKTDNAIIIMDIQGRFEWVNDGFKRIYGYNLLQFKEKFGSSITEASTYKEIDSIFKECINQKHSVLYTSQMVSNSGNSIWTQTTLTPILNEKGEIENLVAIDSDITKIKEAEQFIEKQRDEISKQRDIAIIQKNEITDSIEYAKHIQNAILPSENILKDTLGDYFILNRPKAIVSGDFSWVARKNGKLVFAVADCTGHGVPGALMSMLGVTFLNKIILEKGITDTSEILNRLRANIISALHQTGSAGEASDGMDIAVVSIDERKRMLQFSGAMNPLLIVRKDENGSGYYLKRIKHDVMPIAINQMLEETYTSKSMKLNNEDTIYLFTDGYTDQFGGNEGLRFNFNNFKQLLLKIQKKTMSEQKKILNEELDKWRGTYLQIDDILVLGVKIRYL